MTPRVILYIIMATFVTWYWREPISIANKYKIYPFFFLNKSIFYNSPVSFFLFFFFSRFVLIFSLQSSMGRIFSFSIWHIVCFFSSLTNLTFKGFPTHLSIQTLNLQKISFHVESFQKKKTMNSILRRLPKEANQISEKASRNKSVYVV